MKEDGLASSSQLAAPGWRSTITTSTPARAESDNSTFVDHLFNQGECLTPQRWLSADQGTVV